jgi:hypothetical protein
MVREKPTQLAHVLDQTDAEAVFAAAHDIFVSWYPEGDYGLIANVVSWVKRLFSGDFPGYRGCNTEYHNLFHTTDVLIASARLMDGMGFSSHKLPESTALNLYLASLLHDTGYIQEAEDQAGTGAKYTKQHVDRSRAFLARNAELMGIPAERVMPISILIECTDLRINPTDISFESEAERDAGFILGSADLLGQMADRAYLEKLLFLYYEFKEAGFPGYNTEFDILKNTMGFYESTQRRLDIDLARTYRFASRHFAERYGVDENLYVKSIEGQMNYLQTILDDSSCNFRKKLKRLDLEGYGPGLTAAR